MLNVPHLDSTDPHMHSSRTVPCANASFPQRWGHMTNDLEAKVSHPLCGTPTCRSLDSDCNSEADRDSWLKSSERDGDVKRQGQGQPFPLTLCSNFHLCWVTLFRQTGLVHLLRGHLWWQMGPLCWAKGSERIWKWVYAKQSPRSETRATLVPTLYSEDSCLNGVFAPRMESPVLGTGCHPLVTSQVKMI